MPRKFLALQYIYIYIYTYNMFLLMSSSMSSDRILKKAAEGEGKLVSAADAVCGRDRMGRVV